ncbi:MAG: hypothetical protein AB7L94_36195 [Kofleriaceae bacterium]
MGELAQRDDQSVVDHIGTLNDLNGGAQILTADVGTPIVPAPAPIATPTRWSAGEGASGLSNDGSPLSFIDEDSGLVHGMSPADLVPPRVEAPTSMLENFSFGNVLGAAGNLFGMVTAAQDIGEAENGGQLALATADALSSGVGAIGSLAQLLPGTSSLSGLAGPTANMLASNVGSSAAWVGEAGGLAAGGAALGTAAQLVGAFTAGYGIGTSADSASASLGMFHNDVTGEDDSYTDWISDHARQAWDKDTVGGRLQGAAILGGGTIAGAMAAPFVAAAGSTVGLGKAALGAFGYVSD